MPEIITRQRTEQDWNRDKIDSKFVNLKKTGFTLRNKKLDGLHDTVNYIREIHTGRLLYDIYYSHKEYDGTLTYTEFVSNAIYLHPCSLIYRNKQINDSLLDAPKYDYCDRILSSGKLDKYRLIKVHKTKKIPLLIMLTGSNTFDFFIDVGKVKKLVRQHGAVVKPHPITNNEILAKIHHEFGSENVLCHKSSGFDYVNMAEKVYGHGGTETMVFAAMLGKEIGSIQKKIERPAYNSIFQTLLKSKDRIDTLNRIFSSYKSGLFFNWDNTEKIDNYFEYLKTFEYKKGDW